jgi:AraC family transcriptional regulator, regulatory protein of adaptative response / methylated-DNA-[protein]-cysteine methyltransferase
MANFKPEVIRYAVGKSTLGFVLAGSSEMGVCAILLGDEPELLVTELQRRFPTARLTEGNDDLTEIIALIETPGKLALPLDIRGTAFQQRVWQALCEIPAGSTLSYTQVAGNIGSPKSVRAVAGACAANAIAIAIPCHRVVRSDGNLSGYRWGVARKRQLLDREAAPN